MRVLSPVLREKRLDLLLLKLDDLMCLGYDTYSLLISIAFVVVEKDTSAAGAVWSLLSTTALLRSLLCFLLPLAVPGDLAVRVVLGDCFEHTSAGRIGSGMDPVCGRLTLLPSENSRGGMGRKGVKWLLNGIAWESICDGSDWVGLLPPHELLVPLGCLCSREVAKIGCVGLAASVCCDAGFGDTDKYRFDCSSFGVAGFSTRGVT